MISGAMRNGRKARVFFVDAAWAPMSFASSGKDDSPYSSMLIAMRNILRNRVNDRVLVNREVYKALYDPFLHPLENCSNLKG